MDIELIKKSKQYSHMPFIAEDKKTLFFCLADERRKWKLHYTENGDTPKRLDTGFSDDVIECAPVGWFDDAGWHVSFIAGGGEPDPLYFLYQINGKKLSELSSPEQIWQTKAGFVYRTMTAVVENRDTICIMNGKEIELPNSIIYRVSCRTDKPRVLLVSGKDLVNNEIFVLEYDCDTDQQNLLECDKKCPPYKCSMNEDEIIYADREGKFEERRLVRANTAVRRIASKSVIRTKEERKYNIYRASSIDMEEPAP